jgi:peptidoglycan/LPS O-acetylase OafA/YrhL
MKREIPALTGLRGLAALWVFLFHVRSTFDQVGGGLTTALSFLGGAGFLGVDVFFVLSGFVLALNYADAGTHRSLASYGDFLWKRIARIYPVHLAALALLVLFVAAFAAFGAVYINSARLSPVGLLKTLTLTHGWSLPIVKTWNTVSWSISCEWAAYLVFPLLSLAALRLRSKVAILAIILALFVALAALIGAGKYGGSMPYGLPRIAAAFTSGVLLYRFWQLQNFATSALGDRIALYGIVFLIVGGNIIATNVNGARALLVMPVFACGLVYGLAAGAGPVCKALSSRVAQFAGHISYSFYMIHMLVLGAAVNAFAGSGKEPDAAAAVALALGAGVATVLMAAWMYRAIETPARRAMLGWQKRLRDCPPGENSIQSGPDVSSSSSGRPSSTARM